MPPGSRAGSGSQGAPSRERPNGGAARLRRRRGRRRPAARPWRRRAWSGGPRRAGPRRRWRGAPADPPGVWPNLPLRPIRVPEDPEARGGSPLASTYFRVVDFPQRGGKPQNRSPQDARGCPESCSADRPRVKKGWTCDGEPPPSCLPASLPLAAPVPPGSLLASGRSATVADKTCAHARRRSKADGGKGTVQHTAGGGGSDSEEVACVPPTHSSRTASWSSFTSKPPKPFASSLHKVRTWDFRDWSQEFLIV